MIRLLISISFIIAHDYVKEIWSKNALSIGFDSRCNSLIDISNLNFNNLYNSTSFAKLEWYSFITQYNYIYIFYLLNIFYFGVDWVCSERLNISFNLVPVLTSVIGTFVLSSSLHEHNDETVKYVLNIYNLSNLLSIITIDIKLNSSLNLSYNIGHVLNRYINFIVPLFSQESKVNKYSIVLIISTIILHLGFDSLKLDVNSLHVFSKDASRLNHAFRYGIFIITLTINGLIARYILSK